MFNLLPYKEELDDWMYNYGASRQCNLEYLFRYWEQNKQNLYHLLGDKFFYEEEIEILKPIEELQNEVYKVSSLTRFRTDYIEWVRTFCKDKEDSYDLYYKLISLLDNGMLASNCYNKSTFEIIVNSERIVIQRGCKITKVLNKISKAANIDSYEEFRLAHSQVLNQKILKGTLVFSIHPLDFFSLSDNEYDWSSCMSWRSDGEYRLGTVEMCNSPNVIVAYLRGNASNDWWLNKKWRNLFIVNENIISSIKGYPYQSSELDLACLRVLRQLAEKNLKWTYDNKIFHKDMNNRTNEPHLHFYTDFMYNDFGNSNSHYFVLKNKDTTSIELCYSGEAICLQCGELIYYNDDEEQAGSFLCSVCNPHEYCDGCQGRFQPEDLTEVDGQLLCEYCLEDCTSVDPITGETHLNEYFCTVYLVSDDTDFSKFSDLWDFQGKHLRVDIYDNSNNFELVFKNGIREESLKSSYTGRYKRSFYFVYESDLTELGEDIFRNYSY